MSFCLGCGVKTTRIAKVRVGRYTLCEACVDKGYDINKRYGVWILTKRDAPNIYVGCHEVWIESVFPPERR
jgi:hypothetical protein